MPEKYEYRKLVGAWNPDPRHEFDWCHICIYVNDCYDDIGPKFIEPACGEGPAK